MHESFDVKGIWHLAAYEEDLLPGQSPSTEPVWEETGTNLVVTAGKNLILERLFGITGPPAAVASIGVGTDSTAAVAGQTQLNPTVAGTVLIQSVDSTPTRSSQTVTAIRTFTTAQANFQWNEVGAFNGNTNGTSTMLNRIVVGPFTKSASVSIVVTLTFTQN